MKRQLLWNFRAIPEEQSANYIFIVVNDSRQIETISSRIISALAPVDEYAERKGKADDLQYRLMTFNSNRMIFPSQWGRIYRGRVKKDPRLYERAKTGMEGLEAYVLNELEKLDR